MQLWLSFTKLKHLGIGYVDLCFVIFNFIQLCFFLFYNDLKYRMNLKK